MKRKLYLLFGSALALVAFGAFSVPAQALTDFDCDPFDNVFGLYDVDIDTESQITLAISGVSGEGLACGSRSDISFGAGSGSHFVRADIDVPDGVEVNESIAGSDGLYVGSASVDWLSWLGRTGFPMHAEDNIYELRIDTDPASDCDSAAVLCIRADDAPAQALRGHAWSFLTALYVLADDLLPRRSRARRNPRITDSELVCLAVAQILLDCPSERRFLALCDVSIGTPVPLPTQTARLQQAAASVGPSDHQAAGRDRLLVPVVV